MNIVIVDGIINSLIGKVADTRRTRARFTVATRTGEEVGVEVRGPGAEKLWSEWEPGDGVHVRGRLTAGGFIAADYIRRQKTGATPAAASPALPFAPTPGPVQFSLGLLPSFS